MTMRLGARSLDMTAGDQSTGNTLPGDRKQSRRPEMSPHDGPHITPRSGRYGITDDLLNQWYCSVANHHYHNTKAVNLRQNNFQFFFHKNLKVRAILLNVRNYRFFFKFTTVASLQLPIYGKNISVRFRTFTTILSISTVTQRHNYNSSN